MSTRRTLSWKMQAVEAVIDAITLHTEYEVLGFLGLGRNGGVVAAYDPVNLKNVALKIRLEIPFCEVLREKYYWSRLNHKNIVKLLDVYTFQPETDSKLEVHINYFFTMPAYKRNIRQEMSLPGALSHLVIFDRVMGWLHGVLSALKYLWDRRLSHLDIREQNVMISEYTDEAVLVGLSRDSFQLDFVKRGYAAGPIVDEAGMGGSYFDMRCYGVMCLKVCLHGSNLWYEMKDTKIWYNSEISKVLQRALKEDTFVHGFVTVFEADPNVDMRFAKKYLDFIYSLLDLDAYPSKREYSPPRHPFVMEMKKKSSTPGPVHVTQTKTSPPQPNIPVPVATNEVKPTAEKFSEDSVISDDVPVRDLIQDTSSHINESSVEVQPDFEEDIPGDSDTIDALLKETSTAISNEAPERDIIQDIGNHPNKSRVDQPHVEEDISTHSDTAEALSVETTTVISDYAQDSNFTQDTSSHLNESRVDDEPPFQEDISADFNTADALSVGTTTTVSENAPDNFIQDIDNHLNNNRAERHTEGGIIAEFQAALLGVDSPVKIASLDAASDRNSEVALNDTSKDCVAEKSNSSKPNITDIVFRELAFRYYSVLPRNLIKSDIESRETHDDFEMVQPFHCEIDELSDFETIEPSDCEIVEPIGFDSVDAPKEGDVVKPPSVNVEPTSNCLLS